MVAFAVSCAAQTSRVAGAIQGSVVDQTGSTVAGAKVTLRNQGTNQTRTLSTNAEGFFRAGELPVGQYELRVESSGFSPYVNNAIVVSVGTVVQMVVRLAPATVQQQISVSEQPPPIDPTQTAEATTIDHDRIEESPVVSRNYLDFVLLAPQLTRSNIQGATGGKSALADSGFTFAGRKYGSWLNQAEIEISLLSRQCLGRRRIPSLGDLRREARAWGRRMNRNRVTIDWRFTRKEARLKFGYKRNQIMRSET